MKRYTTAFASLLLIVNLVFAQDYKMERADSVTVFHWPEGKQMALSLSFDDARFSQVDKGIPLLNTYNITGTFYVSPNAMLERVADWKDAVGAGHDIGNHTLARLNGTELDGKSFSEALKLIEEARDQVAWLVFAGHEMNDGGRQTALLSTIDSICQYASDPANGIWIDNVTNIGKYVGEMRGLPEKL